MDFEVGVLIEPKYLTKIFFLYIISLIVNRKPNPIELPK